MKFLKVSLLIVVIAIVGLLVYGLFIPTDLRVVEKISINKPIAEVYDFTKLLKNQSLYSKWQLMDPQMEHYFEGEDGTVGFVSGWKSENPDVGSGEQEIIAIMDGQRIDYELRFFEPFESKSQAFMVFTSTAPDQTEVTWGFDSEMAYPMNLMIPMMDMQVALSDDFSVGLANLKAFLEKN
ncbi:polyketide cyclase/dehydrase/lipid transport protein [Algoriphagus boseongensis]|uniref:Polyketide cyclase/dehydrase/lipid transport protein n=1 Tax=Algoriphagus boseongensis TaxID=1442587 RepID=A0A4R6T7B6_9BACT|nr:SRPBCC family protein [Algoriphagus boseongensis]TDQ16571.1 polyketide cyclase/dehydrase/lipid transport protein [Algoriphagus boseongensis]